VTRIAIVLGAGGPVASTFHLGVLQGLAQVGVHLEDADLVVGTSAGAGIAASLLSGATLDETLSAAITPPSAEDRARMRSSMKAGGRDFRPLAPALALQARPGGAGLGVALAGLLPTGRLSTAPMSRFPSIAEAEWPEHLWIPATRVPDGERVVFGRDLSVPLVDAVEASAAVPGFFVPKLIDGQRYVDGAVRSANSADLAAQSDAELVIVSSVQTRPGHSPLRRAARANLARELKVLRAAGKRVLLLEPGAEVLSLLIGFPMRSPQNAAPIIAAAKRQLLQQLRATPLKDGAAA
jgi:NTE family protein